MNAAGGAASALGTVFRTQKLNIGTLPYNSGQTGSLDVPRGLLLKSIKIRLSGTFTVAGGAVASYNSETPLGLLQRIELTADGRKPFASTDGRMLYRKNQRERGIPGELVSLSNTANGTYAFVAYVTIDLEALRFVFPIDSYLDTRLYDNIRLNITWGAPSALAVVGAGTIAVNAGTQVVVQGEYTAEGFELVKFNKIQITDEVIVSGSTGALRLAVPRNGLLSDLHIRTDVDSVVNDAFIADVTLRSENTVYHADHLDWATHQASQVVENQLITATPGSRINGYFFYDLTEDAMLSTALDTTSVNVLDLLFNIPALPAGTTRAIRVLYNYFEPINR